MLIKSKKTEPSRPSYSEDQFITTNKYIVEHFSNFTDDSLGITRPMNVLAPLGGNSNDYKMTKVAILCENFVRETKASLDETSRADLPKWVKTGLALITTSQADDLTDKVISEQPLQSRSGKIHYLDIQTEKAKGRIPAGLHMFDALRGFAGTEDFGSHKINGEPIGAIGATDYVVRLEYRPCLPRSVEITDGNQVVQDDGNGNLIGDVGAGGGGITNTVNYVTGDVSLQFAAATTGNVEANYGYNIEAATEYPKYGIALRGVQVEALPRAISTEWSHQAVVDLINDWGIDAEPTILDAGGKIITAEKFRHVVNHLYRKASGGSFVFDNATPPALTYREHIDAFGIMLGRLQHEIWQHTQKVRPNVCVLSPDIWFLFQHTKGFQGEGTPGQSDALAGPKIVGTLSEHNILCIADPSFPGGSAVLTFRGMEIFNTAATVGMYLPLYKSPVHQKGFHKDAAMLTEYAIHVMNAEMMGTIQVINL
jgi:hypothetical protein